MAHPSNHDQLVVISLALLVTGLLLSIIYKREWLKEGFSTLTRCSWIANKGVPPNYKKVSVQYLDKSIAWNVSTKKLEWSLDARNPIVEYLPKHK